MKLIKYLLFGLVISLVCGEVDAFAQKKWIPVSARISAPISYSHRDWSECQGNVHDSSWKLSRLISASIWGKVALYSVVNDSISIIWEGGDGYTSIDVNFILDTTTKKLKNLSIRNHKAPDGFDWGETQITYASMNYKESGDTLITGEESGAQSVDKIKTLGFSHTTWGNCNQRLTHYGTNDGFDSLLNDTSRYQCFITLVVQQPVNTVSKLNSIQEGLKILSSHPYSAIYYSFPSSDHHQSLIIYDILGREVKRIEIPSGVSEYSLQRDGFMSGYYFARLGNLNAKFVVN